MSPLWLVRHASTAWSERNRLQGWTPIGLSARGIHEAHEIGRAAARLGIKRILSSPLARARQTALIVARYVAAPIVVAPAFCELNYGALTGCTREELRTGHPQLAEAWEQRPWRVRFTPRYGALMDIASALGATLSDAAPATIPTLCVTHGHVIRVALTMQRRLAPHAIWAAEVPCGSFWRLGRGPRE